MPVHLNPLLILLIVSTLLYQRRIIQEHAHYQNVIKRFEDMYDML